MDQENNQLIKQILANQAIIYNLVIDDATPSVWVLKTFALKLS